MNRKSGVEVFFILGAVAILRVIFAALPPAKPVAPVSPTAECRLAIETLRQNQQGLLKISQDYRRDTLVVMEENRWILDPLKVLVSKLCR